MTRGSKPGTPSGRAESGEWGWGPGHACGRPQGGALVPLLSATRPCAALPTGPLGSTAAAQLASWGECSRGGQPAGAAPSRCPQGQEDRHQLRNRGKWRKSKAPWRVSSGGTPAMPMQGMMGPAGQLGPLLRPLPHSQCCLGGGGMSPVTWVPEPHHQCPGSCISLAFVPPKI